MRRLFALLLAIMAATTMSLTVASPASADTLGPIVNVGNGLCIQPAANVSGSLVLQLQCSTDRNLSQEWNFVCRNASCTTFRVVNRGSGLCLRARPPIIDGGQIMMWPCNQISDLNWDFGPSSGPGFVLRSRVGGTSTHCLDVPGSQTTPGVALQFFRCNGTFAQRWDTPFPVIE